MQFLDNSYHLLRVWLSNARASVVREMEFRGNFLIGVFRQLLWLGAFTLLIEVIFQNTDSLSGWARHEVLIVLALSRLIEGIMGTIFLDNILGISEKVQQGTFDYTLTKPLPIQFATFFSRISLDSIGNLIAGFILLIYSTQFVDNLGFQNFFLAAVIALAGITIYYSLLVTVASLVFYIERLQSLWSFSALFSEPLTVPFDIFPTAPRIALTYILPIAFVVFVPAQALTNKLASWQVLVAVSFAIIFLGIANVTWRAGLRRYGSASS